MSDNQDSLTKAHADGVASAKQFLNNQATTIPALEALSEKGRVAKIAEYIRSNGYGAFEYRNEDWHHGDEKITRDHPILDFTVSVAQDTCASVVYWHLNKAIQMHNRQIESQMDLSL